MAFGFPMFQAVQLLSNGLIFRDHTVRVKAATLEPHGEPRTNQLLPSLIHWGQAWPGGR